MTDTTDQQAVTRDDALAFADEAFRNRDITFSHRDIVDMTGALDTFLRRHRLASVSSASAGYSIAQGQPAETAPYACSVLGGRFDESVGEWVMAVVSTPLVTPFTNWWPLPSSEPVPATNQAGEVAKGLEAIRYNFERIAAKHPNDQPAYKDGVRPFGTGDLRQMIEHLTDAIAALATQPATSQEGEGFAVDSDRLGRALMHRINRLSSEHERDNGGAERFLRRVFGKDHQA